MQKSKSRLAGMLAAFLGMGSLAEAVNPHPSTRDLSDTVLRPRSYKFRVIKRYPEQSSRQAVRGARRQQGGNGIVLTSEFLYVER